MSDTTTEAHTFTYTLPDRMDLEDLTIKGSDTPINGGDMILRAGLNSDGTQGPEVKICADGTFWLDGREVKGDEDIRDAFLYFAEWLRDCGKP